MHRSLWTDTARMPSFKPLSGDRQTDILIIGGGIAGLLCAYQLQKAGADLLLLEADTICSGVTGNTTAKVTAQHGLICHQLLRRFGREKTLAWWRANSGAVEAYRRLCRELDVPFEVRDSFVYSLNRPDKLRRELEATELLGIPGVWEDRLSLPFPTAGAVRLPEQGQIHPLRLLGRLAQELPIFEHTPVRELVGCKAITDSGTVTAGQIVIATHFPILNKHGSYFLKLYQHRSYVLALERAQPVEGMYVDEAEDGLSFRDAEGLLLLGGGSHRTGKKGGGWRELEDVARRYWPDARLKYRWAAQDCMTLDGLPYVGRYSARTPNLYVTTGFNKWGMTSAMAASVLLCDLLQGKADPLESVFSPSRTMLRPQLAVNGCEAALNLLTPTTRRCPHLGCALKWNPQEHSWDCPCHGSRFARDGRLLDGPATGDLPRKEDL